MKISATILALLVCAAAAAQTDTIVGRRVVTNAMMAGIGHTDILDTYLSPEKYKGIDARFVSHTTRQREGHAWSCQLVHQGNFSLAENRSGDGSEMAGMYNFQYAWHRNWHLLGDKLQVKAGAMAEAGIGFIYNTRNSNNPAQAKAYLNIGPSAAARYSFRLWNRPFAVRYEASVPLVGIMFSPNYGQSYYEIFSRGNYDHNLVPTTFVSAPSMRQMLSLDFMVAKTVFRIGYLGDIQQSHVNNLKSHTYTHAFVIGIVRRFKTIKLRP